MALTTKIAGALVEGGARPPKKSTVRVMFVRNRTASGKRYFKGDVASISAADAELLMRLGVV